VQKRRKSDYSAPLAPMIEGASSQVREWSHGNLPKRDALRFSRVVCFKFIFQFSRLLEVKTNPF
jgi:hypothetical protein